MATFIKGNSVENATSYELNEKNGDGTYSALETKNEINFEVSALGLATGDHTLVVKAKADGYDDSDYSNEVVYSVEEAVFEGEWLSNAITGDSGRHDEYMGATDLSGALTNGYDVIYYTSAVQSIVEGKPIYKIACGNLGAGGTLTLYSNPWASSGTLSAEGRTVIGTVTAGATADETEPAGSMVKVYNVSNPLPIKEGETLALAWSTKLKSVANGFFTSNTTNAKYKTPTDDEYKSIINNFSSFDLFVGV